MPIFGCPTPAASAYAVGEEVRPKDVDMAGGTGATKDHRFTVLGAFEFSFFRCKIFLNFDTVVFSFLFDKYCLIME
jgi:hypothetical protein